MKRALISRLSDQEALYVLKCIIAKADLEWMVIAVLYLDIHCAQRLYICGQQADQRLLALSVCLLAMNRALGRAYLQINVN